MKTKKNIIVILIAVLMIFSHCVTAAASEGAANRRTVTTEDNDEEKRPEKEEKEEKEEDTEKEEKEEKEEDPKKEETEDDPKKEETEEKEEDTEKEEEGPDEGETEGDDETEGEGEGETEGEGDTDGEKEGPAAPKLFAEGENFRIGEDGTSYAKLEDAAAAVEDGETIYMLTDVEVAAYDILDVAKTYTIDLGGHELSSDATLTLKISGGNVTIQNGYLSNQWMAAISVGGSPKVTLSGLNVSCIGVYDADFAVLLEGSGEVDILSGEYHGGKHAVNVADGKVTITGGRFTSDNSAALYAYDPNFISIANGSAATREDWLNNSGVQEVTVSPIPNFDNAFLSGLYYQVGDGETIAVPDFEQNKYEYTILLPGDTSLPAVINLYPEPVASGATITSDTAVTLPGVDETVKVTVRAMDETTTKTYSLRFRIMAQNFQIDDGRYYNDLEDAVRDVEDGGTIVMLKDVEVRYGIQLNNIDKDCVIDLGGNTIIVPDFTSLFSIQNSAGTVEFKNGKIESAGINCIFIEGSTVILSYLTVSATGGDNQYAVNTKDSDVTIRGGSYFGYNSAVNYDGGSVTIYTGTFKSTGRAALAEVEGGNISIAPGYFPTGTPWKGYDGLNEVEVVAGLPLANKTDVSDSITFDPGSANYVYNVEQDCAPAAIATTYPGGYWTYEYEPAGGNAALGANGKPLNAGEYSVTATYEAAEVIGSATEIFTVGKPSIELASDGLPPLVKEYDGTGTCEYTGEAVFQTTGDNPVKITHLIKDTDYRITAEFNGGDYDAGINKNYTYAAELLDTAAAANYTHILSGIFGSDGEITPAKLDPEVVEVTWYFDEINTEYEVTIEASKLLPELEPPREYKTLSYTYMANDVKDGIDIIEPFDNVNTNGNFQVSIIATEAGKSAEIILLANTGNYSTIPIIIHVVFPFNEATLGIEPIEPQGYTGNQITPAPIVKYGDTALTPGTDYTVSYGENINAGAGAGSVTVTGTGLYNGSSGGAAFDISPYNIAGLSGSHGQGFTYNGFQQKPAPGDIAYTFNGYNLAHMVDFTYAVTAGGTDAGQAEITLAGVGNFTGTKALQYAISPAPLTLKADDKTVLEGGGEPAYTFSATGLKGSDSKESVITKRPVFRLDRDFDGNRPGTYSILLSGAETNGNYTINAYEPGTLTVAESNKTAIINGASPRIDDTLTGELLGGLALGYTWYADGARIGAGAEYTVTIGDLGKRITVVINSTSGAVESAATEPVLKKAAPAAPDAPVIASADTESVTLALTPGYEYSADGVIWRSENVFDGLTPGTEYTFYQRIAETADTEASLASPGTVVITAALTYGVTVNGSYAAVSGAGRYAPGDTVTINAGYRSGYTFASWAADGVSLADSYAETASFTMPERDVNVTARWSYRDINNGPDGDEPSAPTPPPSAPNPAPNPVPARTPSPAPADDDTMTVPGFGGAEDNLQNVSGTIDKDSGAVTLDLDGGAVESLIADALAAAREESASPVVTLDLSETEQARAAVLGIEVIKAFESAGITLTIKLPAAEITLPPEALEALTLDYADAVSIIIEDASVPQAKLTPMQAAQVKGLGTVIDVSVFADGNEIDVPMTISLPYQLKYGENPAAVCCWHLDDEGNLTRLNGVYDASTGVISAEINHQSYYVVGYDPVALWENALGDVSAGDWYYDAVAFANYYGLMGGYGSGAFVPDDTVTRAMFITILWNLEGKPRDQRTENREQLKDVGDSDWYAEAAVWGIENGIIFPVTDGVFAPNAPIYRQDMAVVFANYANYKGYALPRLRLVTGFTDREQISAWADEAALRLVEAGVMDRDGGGFAPHNTATRAELARMIKNLLTRTEIKKGSEPR